MRHEGDKQKYDILHERATYGSTMAQVDRAAAHHAVVAEGLRDLQMRLNPLRPAAMQHDPSVIRDVRVFEDPQWQQALFDFNKGYNHPSCNIPQMFMSEMQQYKEEKAKGPEGERQPEPLKAKPPESAGPS